MKQTFYASFLGFILLLLFTSAKKKIRTTAFPIDELIASGKIHTKMNGTATFNAQCLSFDLSNLTSDTLCILLESGKKLNSGNQNVFIIKSNVICIPPHQTLVKSGYVFYYENPTSTLINGSSASNELTAEKWRKLSKVINENDYSINTIQAAIWCITDNHPVNSITSEDMKNIQLLRRVVSEIQKNELPWYYITFHEDTTVLYSEKHTNVIGNIEFYVQSSTIITINIRNKQNEVMTTLIKESAVGPGNHKFSVNASVSLWSKGEYAVYVYEDYSKVICRKTFEL